MGRRQDRGRQSLTLPHIPSLLQFLLSLSVASSSTWAKHRAEESCEKNEVLTKENEWTSKHGVVYLFSPPELAEHSLEALVHVVKLDVVKKKKETAKFICNIKKNTTNQNKNRYKNIEFINYFSLLGPSFQLTR